MAVTAAIEEASDSTDCQAGANSRCDGVGQSPSGDTQSSGGEPARQCVADPSTNRGAVKDDPTLPEAEKLGPRDAVLNHEDDSSPYDSAKKDGEGEIENPLARDPLTFGSPSDDPQTHDKGKEQHQPEAIHGDARRPEIERDWDSE
jgi:hypothetical protein